MSESTREAVQKQLETIFSPLNLKADASVMAQLNSQRFISFDAVLALPSIAALTTDRELVVAAASASSQFTLDESKSSMKPINLKVERTTLILRDIPSAAPADDVKVLFQGLASAPVSVNADVGDNWFVTFASEDACLAAAMHLRSQTFAGKPVQARVKSENFLSAYKPVTARPSQFAAPFVPYYYDPNFYAQQQTPASPTKGGRVKQQQPSPKSRRGEQSPQQPQQQQQQPRPASKARGSASSVAASIAAGGAAGTPDVQASGYSHPFTRYSREQMASIVRHTISTGANARPASLTFGQSPAARNQPQADTQLLAPVPLFYPASPSPMLAARSSGSPSLLPSFDLGGGNSISAASPNVRPLPPALLETSASGVTLMHYGGAMYSLPAAAAANQAVASMGSMGGLQQPAQKPMISSVLSAAKAEAKAMSALPPRRPTMTAAAAPAAPADGQAKPARKKAAARQSAVVDVIASAVPSVAPVNVDPSKRTAASIVASNADKPMQPKRVPVSAPVAPSVEAVKSEKKEAEKKDEATPTKRNSRTPKKQRDVADPVSPTAAAPAAANKPLSYAAMAKAAAKAAEESKQ